MVLGRGLKRLFVGQVSRWPRAHTASIMAGA
jgi:hypothetical protein